MIGPVVRWTIEIADGHAVARSGAEEVAADTPAELWRALGRRASGALVHLLDIAMEPLPAGFDTALREMAAQGLDAMIGRVRFAGGGLSPRFGQTEAARYLAVPAGAIVVTGEALMGAADEVGNGWDAFWSSDLANGLRHTCLVGGFGEVLAVSPDAPPASPRLPFMRASTLPPTDPAAPLILVYGKIAASVSLYFDGLPPDLRAQLRFLEPGDLFSDLGWLAAASLVIVVRGFEHMLLNGTHELLGELGVPYVWFTDDDFGALATEVPDLGFYTPEALRTFTAGAAGIVATSAPLSTAVSRLHANIIAWPAVYDVALEAPAGSDPAFIAGAFGGAFRHRAFVDRVLPALAALSIPTFASAELARSAAGLKTLPFEPGFRRFVFRWQRLGLRVLAHPEGVSGNMGNKSRASLLAAAYLGAVPVVGDEPAYADCGAAQGVLKVKPDQASWQAALSSLSDHAYARELLHALRNWCRTEFDPELARKPFAELLSLALPGGRDAQALRLLRAIESKALQRALPRRTPIGRAIARLRRLIRQRLR